MTRQNKYCPRCDCTKPATEFYSNKARGDGLASYCKDCTKLSVKESYNRNIVKRRKNERKYYYENSESIKQKHKNYYIKNSKKIKDRERKRYHENRDNRLKQMNDYYYNNREILLERHKKYYQDNKEMIINNIKKYQSTEKGKEVRRKIDTRRYRNLDWIKLIDADWNCNDMHYHHVNDKFVIPIPADIHMSFYGNDHRKRCNDWIERKLNVCINKLIDDYYENQ